MAQGSPKRDVRYAVGQGMRWGVGGTLLALVIVGGVGDAMGGKSTKDVFDTYLQIPKRVEYVRKTAFPPWPNTSEKSVDEWTPLGKTKGRYLYDVTTYIVEGNDRKRAESVRVFVGKEGYGYLGTLSADGTVAEWDPPQVVLPPNPKAGDHWSGEHRQGEVVAKRDCELRGSEVCVRGLVSVCVSESNVDESKSRRVVLRDHFCPGVGWSGFDALVTEFAIPEEDSSARSELRMWSEQMTIDDKPAPSSAPAAPSL